MFITMFTNKKMTLLFHISMCYSISLSAQVTEIWRILTTLVDFVSCREASCMWSFPNSSFFAIVCALLSSACSTIGDKWNGQISQSNGLRWDLMFLLKSSGVPRPSIGAFVVCIFLCPYCLPLPITVMCRCPPPLLLLWWFCCRRLCSAYLFHVFNFLTI